MWRPHLSNASPMKYLGIVEALEADIRAGRVARGERVPPQRAIAEALEVDLTTVTRAFNEARRRGLIQAQPGRGTFICEAAGNPDGRDGAQPVLDLSMNTPPQPMSPDFRRIFPQGVSDILASSRGLMALHYQESNGIETDRKAAASWLSSRIEGVAADRIIVTGGAQCALFSICELLLSPGDVVAAGAMTYPGIKAVAVQKRLQLEPVAMDALGIIPDAFENICRVKKPKALYVVPTIDNPTTATLPEQRRRALVMLARQYGVLIFEDDPYAALRPERMAAIAELGENITWHIATLSKCVTPALRIAFVVAPSAGGARRLAAVLRATNLMAPPLMSALASRWIVDGTLDEVTAAISEENAVRQKLASTILEGSRYCADPHGHHLWLHLPEHWRAADFAGHADRAGVSIVPASTFAITPHSVEAVRISIGVAPDRDTLENGLTQLASLILEPSLGTRAVV